MIVHSSAYRIDYSYMKGIHGPYEDYVLIKCASILEAIGIFNEYAFSIKAAYNSNEYRIIKKIECLGKIMEIKS